MNKSSIASSSDACASIVNSLMHHRQGGESESFSRSAITSLVKKLKEKRDELDALITAITTNGAQMTPCVTICKTLDGRLQVASRKGFPHVIYAKIWRWPDLHKNELKQMDFCQYGFDHKDKDLVCVNPYHYNRVIGPGLDLSGLNLSNLSQVQAWNAYNQATMNAGWNNGAVRAPATPHPSTGGQFYHGNGTKVNGDGNNWFAKPGTLTYTANGKNNGNVRSNPEHWELARINNGQNHMKPEAARGSPATQNFLPPNPAATINHAHGSVNPGSIETPRVQQPPKPPGPISLQPFPEEWCSVAYFEVDAQVGETFKVPSKNRSVVVDGYFESLNNSVGTKNEKRFGLGALTNVHRTEASEKTRRYIGKGLKLDLEGEGDVWVTCLSGYAIFVQSYYLDREAGRTPGDVVHKLYPDAHTKVFDLRQCYDQMRLRFAVAKQTTKDQAGAVAGHCNFPVTSVGFTNAPVDDLRRLCILRMSFVKGWGPDYAKRQTIKETPCWIEIHLHRALQLCDEILNESNQTSSKT